jgi:hypothetical protein
MIFRCCCLAILIFKQAYVHYIKPIGMYLVEVISCIHHDKSYTLGFFVLFSCAVTDIILHITIKCIVI